MLNINETLLDKTTSDEFFLLMHISRYMSIENGTCFPSIATLSKKSGFSKPHVIKTKKALIEKGYISEEHREDSKKGYVANLYTIETDLISVTITLKGKKAIEESSEKHTKKTYKKEGGSKQDLQGVVNGVYKGSKQDLQGVVNDVNPNNLDISFNNLNIENKDETKFEKPLKFGEKKLTDVLEDFPTESEKEVPSLSLKNKLTNGFDRTKKEYRSGIAMFEDFKTLLNGDDSYKSDFKANLTVLKIAINKGHTAILDEYFLKACNSIYKAKGDYKISPKDIYSEVVAKIGYAKTELLTDIKNYNQNEPNRIR